MCSILHLENHLANNQMNVKLQPNVTVTLDPHRSYLDICLDRSLSFRTHLYKLKNKVSPRVALIKRLASVWWGASFQALRTSCLALPFAPAEFCVPSAVSQHSHQVRGHTFKRVDACHHRLLTKHAHLFLAHFILHHPT